MRVAVVGATGAVGREILRILDERSFPCDDVALFASPRSEGVRIPVGGEERSVRAIAGGWHGGIDIALVSAGGSVSREILPDAARAGTVGIDNSSAFRMDPGVPLVIPEINAEAIASHRGIIANPNCSAITALMPLGPLHRAFGLRQLITSSYQSTSGSGHKGVRELAEQVDKLHERVDELGHPDPAALPQGDVFARTIAFNVIPLCEQPDPAGSGFTTEEMKMGNEARKILGIPDLMASATSVRVPTVAGHGVSIYARFDRRVSPASARQILSEAPGIGLVDDLAAGELPTPLDAAGIDDVLVGRVRQPQGDPHALLLFAVGDNLRKGAALNAVQIAERLVSS